MKKSMFLLVFVLVAMLAIPGSLKADDQGNEGPQYGKFSITVSAGIRSISEQMYERVFGKNNIAYGLDLSYRLGNSVSIFMHTDYLSVNGETTLTKEAAKLTIMPIEAGMRFYLAKGKFVPYIGFGAGYYDVKEEVSIGNETNTFSAKEVGFFGEGGLKFYFTNSLFIDLKGKYVSLTISPEENIVNDGNGFIYLEERKLAGIAFLGGLGISF